MTNKEIAEIIFSAITKKTGKEVYEIQWLDGYFIFEMGKDSVVHFKVKGANKWLFGMWFSFDSEEDSDDKQVVIQFFTQHLHNIDKFKPRASLFRTELTLSDFNDIIKDKDDSWVLWKITTIVQQIIYNPIPSYCMDLYCSYYCDEKYLKSFLCHEYRYYKRKISTWLDDLFTCLIHKPKTFFIRLLPYVRKCEWIDNNVDGIISYPRYEMNIKIKDIYIDDLDKIELWLCRIFFRKYLKPNLHNNMYDNISISIYAEKSINEVD